MNLAIKPTLRIPAISPWAVYSVWRRHAKLYQRTWLVNFVSPVTEPLFYLMIFGYGLAPLIGRLAYNGKAIDYMEFTAAAIISMGLLTQSFYEGAYGTFSRIHYQKTWQAFLTGPLNFAEVFLGEWFWASTKGFIVGLIAGLVLMLVGLYSPVDLLLSLPFILLGSLVFAAVGMVVGGVIRHIDQVSVFTVLFLVPMFNISGTYFPRESLPEVLRAIAAVLPLASLLDLLRWQLGVGANWWMGLLWLLFLMVALPCIAARLIYPQLIR
jgi:lipooligosaccharide transport system permease protein